MSKLVYRLITRGLLTVVLTVFLLGWLPTPVGALATTRYVAPGGSCGGHTPCYASLQAAVDAASSGDTILVAEGTYTGLSTRGEHTQLVYLNRSLTIRGGYTTAFAEPPDPAVHQTILDAEVKGRVFYIPDISAATIVLEGLRLIHGSDYESLTGDNTGSAIRMVGSNDDQITLRNNRVYDNASWYDNPIISITRARVLLTGNDIHDNGGIGVEVEFDSDSVVLLNNTISNNGVASDNEPDPGSGAVLEADSIELSGNTFSGNGLHGAYLLSATSLTVTGNTFSTNSGNGLMISGGSGAVTGNDFSANWRGASVQWTDDLLIYANTFQNNYNPSGAGIGAKGAGLSLGYATVSVVDNLFSGNQSYFGGGVSVFNNANYSASIRANRFISNQSGDGGAIHLEGQDSTSLVVGNTISDNQGQYGGGLAVAERAAAVVQDNVFSGNVASTGGGAIYCRACTLTLERNWFTRNMGVTYGNAIHIQWLSLSMYGIAQTESRLVSNLIYDHETDSTPTVTIHNAKVSLLHNTIIRNPASPLGVGVWVEEPLVDLPASAVLTNTIVAGHYTGVYLKAGSMSLEGTLWGAGTWDNTTDTYGAVVTGTVNLWGDPLFVDQATGDYHISATSPARDQGVPAAVAFDVDHELRPHSDTGLYDIGADEYHLDDVFVYVYLPAVLK